MNGTNGQTAATLDTAATFRPTLTHCAMCHAPLDDAKSVEVGIGPVCRKRCDYDSIPEALRTRANELIARVSLNLKDPSEVRFAADELRAMGLERLAACLLEKSVTIFLSGSTETIAGYWPYMPSSPVLAQLPDARWCYGRFFRRGRGAWVITNTQANRDILWRALVEAFPGQAVKIVGQAVPVFLAGDAMPSLAADSAEPEMTANDHAREIRKLLKALDFGGRKARFDVFSFSLAAANAGYSADTFLASPTRALREFAADAHKVLDPKASRSRKGGAA